MFSIHHYWSWLVPKILKMTEDTCTLTTCSYMCQAWGEAELTGNLLCHVHNPNILEQAALVKSDGPQFSSFFTLQTAYSTVVPIGEKKTVRSFFLIVCAITVFNVSFIFTAVLVAAVRNWSACHVLLSQDKGSSTLHLGRETSKDKGSWVSVLASTHVLYKSCQVFLHLHFTVKETPHGLCFWEIQADPSLGATGMWLLRA